MASGPSTPAMNTPPTVTPTASRPVTPNLSTPPPGTVAEQPVDDGSKIKTLLSILRKFIGVTDIANVRFSLPASILSPQPNLEYWHYIDRPDTFVSMGKSDSDIGRMLEVLRFWYTKDLKFIKGKVCKPYNSTLGEFFRCNWDIKGEAPTIETVSKAPAQTPPDPSSSKDHDPVRITYFTEQTSHHPPVSAYWVECPERGVVARGYDQISAKFSGTYLRVVAGVHNKGIFITLKKRDNEEYSCNHPDSNLQGLLRAAPYIAVADTCYIKCPKTKLKTILHYVEEGYFGKAQNKMIAIVYRYDPDDDKYTKLKDVPEKEILVRLEGDWKDRIYYTVPASDAVKKEPGLEPTKEKQLLVDIGPLNPVPKIVPPPEEQLDNESRKLWEDVTFAINEKRYNDATRVKQEIEQTQRDKAAARERDNKAFQPRFFTAVTDESGKPELTEEGRKALEDMQKLNFHLEPRLEDSVPKDS